MVSRPSSSSCSYTVKGRRGNSSSMKLYRAFLAVRPVRVAQDSKTTLRCRSAPDWNHDGRTMVKDEQQNGNRDFWGNNTTVLHSELTFKALFLEALLTAEPSSRGPWPQTSPPKPANNRDKRRQDAASTKLRMRSPKRLGAYVALMNASRQPLVSQVSRPLDPKPKYK